MFNKKDGYRQQNVRQLQPKAHFGLPWLRPWDNRGKCHMLLLPVWLNFNTTFILHFIAKQLPVFIFKSPFYRCHPFIELRLRLGSKQVTTFLLHLDLKRQLPSLWALHDTENKQILTLLIYNLTFNLLLLICSKILSNSLQIIWWRHKRNGKPNKLI